MKGDKKRKKADLLQAWRPRQVSTHLCNHLPPFSMEP